jgi:hypothetical protein
MGRVYRRAQYVPFGWFKTFRGLLVFLHALDSLRIIAVGRMGAMRFPNPDSQMPRRASRHMKNIKKHQLLMLDM